MSSTTASSKQGNYVNFDEFVDIQLTRTRTNVKRTDVITALVGSAVLILGYLLAFVLLDHWVVPGGFGVASRISLLLLLVAAVVTWVWWFVARPCLRNVNGLFAARLIEKSDPNLKSSLLNLVDLQNSGRPVRAEIKQSLEKRAAVQLADFDVDQAIDRRPLLYLSYALLGLVALFCLYTLLSPKRISSSVLRAFLPAANVEAATRTEIVNLTPGDTEVAAGSLLEVQVDLRGEIPQTATIYYSTADRQFVDVPVEMYPDDRDPNRFRGTILGETGRGIVQNLTYRVQAGDATSRDYTVKRRQPPIAEVQQVEYIYPEYMQLPKAEPQPGGNIEAWEGTTVKISASANMPVSSARVVFSDTQDFAVAREQRLMQVSGGTKLTVTLDREINFRVDGSRPFYYRIECRDKDDQVGFNPIPYSVTIRPDLPPEVSLLDPKRDLEVPINASIPLLVSARDDFRVVSLTLWMQRTGDERYRSRPIFEGTQKDYPAKTFVWKPSEDYPEIKVGDRINYHILARDNRPPTGRTRKTNPPLTIRFVAPVSKQEAEKQLKEDRERQKKVEQEARQEEQQRREGEPQPGEQQNPGQNSEDQPRDGERKPGEQKDMNQQQGKQPQNADQKKGSGSEGDPQAGEDQQRPQERKQNGDQKNGKGQGEGGEASPDGKSDPSGKSGMKSTSKDSKSGNDSKQGEEQGEAGKSQPGKNSSGGKGSKSPENLKTDGTDDDKVLQSLRDRQRAEQQKSGDKPTDDGSSNQPQSGQKTGNSGNNQPMTGEKGSKKEDPGTAKSHDQKRSDGEKSDTNPRGESKPEGSEGKPGGSEKPMSGDRNRGDKKMSGDANEKPENDTSGKSDTPDKTGRGGEKPRDGMKPSPGDKDPSSSKPAAGEKPGSDKTGMKPGEKGMPEKGMAEKSASGDNKAGQKNSDGKGMNDEKGMKKGGGRQGEGDDKMPKNGSTEKGAGDTPTGENGMEKAPAGRKNGDAKAKDEGDKPDASPGDPRPGNKKQKGSGDEKGTAAADNDPNADPMRLKDKNSVQRRPGDKPATRPGNERDPQSKTGAENSEKKTGGNKATDKNGPAGGPNPQGKPGEDQPSAKNPTTGKPMPRGNGVDEKNPDMRPSAGEDSPNKNTARKTGQPDQGNPDLKGKGRPQGQDSENPQGGEQGSSTKSDQGMKGGGEPGAGDSGTRAGKQQNSDGKTGMPSGDKSGKGSKSTDSPQGQGKDGKGSDESGQGGPDAAGKPGGDSGKGNNSQEGGGKGSTNKPGSGSPGGSPNSSSGGGANAPDGDGNAPRRRGNGGGNGPDGDVPRRGEGRGTPPANEPEAADLDAARKASELVLKKIKDDLNRGEVDEKWLKENGWTKDNLRDFADRLQRGLNASKKPAASTDLEERAQQRQFEELIRNVAVRGKRADRKGADNIKEQSLDRGSIRTRVPKRYQRAFQNYSESFDR